MKSFLIVATLLTLTACCGCMDKPKPVAVASAPSSAHPSCATAKVSGMTCEACAATVTANLQKISGVRQVETDVAAGKVRIYSAKASDVDAKTVKAIIEKSGYTFTSLHPTCH